ncbi:MAG TPA: hypothetical protein VOB72_27600 [Candidatus Dormibacteraeota bacterium]|nr:hypothetical protein [Candidatus Dormibacteraeota bacterium]
MTRELRWRIVTLQVILVLVLGFCAGFLFWGSSFVNGMVRDELVAQKIYFPPSSEIKPGGALDPATFSTEIREYAGQQVDSGDKAQVYANDFIAVHLTEVANGQTYSQVSAAALANPTNTALANQANTLFRGETLRGLLLNAYGWSQVALYAFYAAIGLTIAAIAVLGALVFEVVVAPRTARAPQQERTLA